MFKRSIFTLFFIALTATSVAAQPLAVEQSAKHPGESATAYKLPPKGEIGKSILQGGLYIGAVGAGTCALWALFNVPIKNIGFELIRDDVLAKVFLMLAADSKNNREGVLSRFIKGRGFLVNGSVGLAQMSLGGLIIFTAVLGMEAAVRSGTVSSYLTTVPWYVGCFALGVANCEYGVKKLGKIRVATDKPTETANERRVCVSA